MVWWQFAALMGSVAGTCLALLAILEYKVDEFCQGSREAPESTRNQITKRRDGLAVRSSTYRPRPARDLPRCSDLGVKLIQTRSDLQTKIVRARSDLEAEIVRTRCDLRTEIGRARCDLGVENARIRTDLRVEVADLRRRQADFQWDQAQFRRQQAELRRQQQTLRQGLAEMRGYLRGLNL